MRISDWSSDVCSSDLLIALEAVHAAAEGGRRFRRAGRVAGGLELQEGMDVVEQVLAHLLQVAADPGDCAEAGVYPVDRLVQGLRGVLALQLAQGIAMFRRPARH